MRGGLGCLGSATLLWSLLLGTAESGCGTGWFQGASSLTISFPLDLLAEQNLSGLFGSPDRCKHCWIDLIYDIIAWGFQGIPFPTFLIKGISGKSLPGEVVLLQRVQELCMQQMHQPAWPVDSPNFWGKLFKYLFISLLSTSVALGRQTWSPATLRNASVLWIGLWG